MSRQDERPAALPTIKTGGHPVNKLPSINPPIFREVGNANDEADEDKDVGPNFSREVEKWNSFNPLTRKPQKESSHFNFTIPRSTLGARLAGFLAHIYQKGPVGNISTQPLFFQCAVYAWLTPIIHERNKIFTPPAALRKGRTLVGEKPGDRMRMQLFLHPFIGDQIRGFSAETSCHRDGLCGAIAVRDVFILAGEQYLTDLENKHHNGKPWPAPEAWKAAGT